MCCVIGPGPSGPEFWPTDPEVLKKQAAEFAARITQDTAPDGTVTFTQAPPEED